MAVCERRGPLRGGSKLCRIRASEPVVEGASLEPPTAVMEREVTAFAPPRGGPPRCRRAAGLAGLPRPLRGGSAVPLASSAFLLSNSRV